MLLMRAPASVSGLLHPLPVEFGFRAAAVHFQRAVLAHRVWADEDPVLPGGEPGPLLDRDAHLLVPIEIVGREGDQAQFGGGLGAELLADARACRVDRFRFAAEMRTDTRLLADHRIGSEIQRR